MVWRWACAELQGKATRTPADQQLGRDEGGNTRSSGDAEDGRPATVRRLAVGDGQSDVVVAGLEEERLED